MEKQEKCPWYVWIFSFFAMFVMFASIEFRILGSFFQRKFNWSLWGEMIGEAFVDVLMLFMIPLCLLTAILLCISEELWMWMGFPLTYLLGIYPAIRLWRWRRKHLQ